MVAGDVNNFHFMSYWVQSMYNLRCQHLPLNNSSYFTGPILTKLHRNVPEVTTIKIAKRN